jgi:hypothetical protein
MLGLLRTLQGYVGPSILTVGILCMFRCLIGLYVKIVFGK